MKTPRNLCQGDAGQMSLLPEPEFSPVWPSASTLEATALELFLRGRGLTHDAFERLTQSWRLSHYVNMLRKKGWPVDTIKIAAPTEDNPARYIALYALPQKFISLALALRSRG